MGNSGIEWIDTIYDWAVILLVEIAKFLGISYEEVNVWIFVFILPTVMVLLFCYAVVLQIRVIKLKKQLRSVEASQVS